MKSSETACRAIRAAATESEVIQVVSDYIESLEPSTVALLPSELMAIGLSQAEEVIHSALQVVRGQVARSKRSPEGKRLRDIVQVLSTAAQRLAALAKKPA